MVNVTYKPFRAACPFRKTNVSVNETAMSIRGPSGGNEMLI